jgi:hypothetical protein
MGRDNRQRRQARKRAQATAAAAPDRHEVTPTMLRTLIAHAVILQRGSPGAGARHVSELAALSRDASEPGLDPARMVTDEVVARVGVAYEHGWQPLDVVHVVRRRGTSTAAAWVAMAVLHEAARSGAAGRAPQPWVDQLSSLSDEHGPVDADGLLAVRGAASPVAWAAALMTLAVLRELPAMSFLLPPPSAWGQPTAHRSPPRASGDPRTLRRIRALLAKAESTEFDAEAEALTAKAQDLMTRHAIDEARLRGDGADDVEVVARRVLIENPYAWEKAGLLHHVAAANRTRAIWSDFGSSATIVGVPTDVEQVEMLFTSLLVQATRAMTEAGRASGSGADRSVSFRKSFLSAYAVRIGERLLRTSDAAVASYGSELVPVFARQEEAVGDEFERLFPHVTQSRGRRTYDRRGWSAGTRAADEAVLPAGEVEARP